MRALRLLLVFVLAVVSGAAAAQALEEALMPGKVIAGHAKYEAECKSCHVRFNKEAQSQLCLDCHKDVAGDWQRQVGFHGRIKKQPCKECHTDHKGREARIVEIDEKNFDHKLTDFALGGKHGQVKCADCHKPKAKYREAPGACNACHRKDDVHKGGLGDKCADCHNDRDWKETRFDHGKTKFELRGKHVDVVCKDCHVVAGKPVYKDLPMTCISCHRKDDQQKPPKGHRGLFGEKCDSCHGEKDWKTIHFNHERDGKYALRGKHQSVRCEACHLANPYKEELKTVCVACHRDDDQKKGHKGSLGEKCESCHNEKSWKETRFDHGKTKFVLLGKHADVACKDCHVVSGKQVYKDLPATCIACHRKDDKGEKGHKGRYGEKCETCHNEKKWSETRFDHDRDTKYVLKDKHRKVKCDDCHTGQVANALYKDKLQTACVSCHRQDDQKKGHKGKIGNACDQCHNEKSWKVPNFDHGRTRYPLTGKHLKVACDKCHQSLAYRDAAKDCGACHEKEDVHKKRLGLRCEACHNARDWRSWDFDHDRRTRFKLDGAHAKKVCEVCHVQPGKEIRALATTCYACHQSEDVHDGAFGRRCEQCHLSTTFREIVPGVAGRRGR